jgi:hypothetical protein
MNDLIRKCEQYNAQIPCENSWLKPYIILYVTLICMPLPGEPKVPDLIF